MLTKFILILSAIASIGSIATINLHQPERAIATSTKIARLPTNEIEQIARAVTVQVYAGKERGSGILIASKDNTYTVITNAHVSDRGKTHQIVTSDGIKHQAIVVKDGTTAGSDLAVLQFTSDNTYQVAKLGDSNQTSKGVAVTAAGFPYDRNDLLITQGQISLVLDKSLAKGYQIGFSNETVQGMSGGVLLNSKGEAIGILGKGKGALLDSAYNYDDGTTPTAEAVEKMKDASFSVPVANIAQLSPQLASLVPGSNPSVAQAPPEAAPQPKFTGYAAEVDRIAEQITVRIDNLDNNANGSGVIIANQGNTYYGLTAKHVVCQEPISKTVCEPNGTHQIVTADGATHQLDYQNVEANQAWLDMAIFSFESSNNYEVATIGKYQPPANNPLVFISGFPKQYKSSDAKPSRILTGGVAFPEEEEDIQAKEIGSLNKASGTGQDGLIYTNISHKGMSGGAVLDTAGRLVGINTGSEQELYFDEEGNYGEIAIGLSLGEAITDLFGYLAANQTQLQTAWLNAVEEPPPLPPNQEIKSNRQQFLSAIEKPQDENDVAAWMNYGSYLWRHIEPDEAIATFEKVIALDPNFDKAYYAMATAYRFKGKEQQKIVEVLTKAIEINPNPYYYWRELGKAHIELKQYDRALAAYDEAIAKNQGQGNTDYVLYLQKASTLALAERYEEAIESYGQAIAINSSNPISYGSRGNVYSILKQYDKAIPDYDKAIEINPLDKNYYENRATAYQLLGQYDQAIPDYDKAIEIAPRFAIAYSNRSSAYRELKQYDRAVADAKKAIELNPKVEQAYGTLGNIYSDLKQYDKAVAQFDKAIEINPQNAFSYNNRSIAYQGLKQYDLAIADVKKSIELNPQNVNAYVNLGIIHQNLKQYDKAIAQFDRAIQLNPQSAFYYHSRGFSYQKTGQHETAIADYSQAIELAPKSANIYNARGSAYQELQQYEPAIADYNLVLKLDPQAYSVLKKLALIDYEKNSLIAAKLRLATALTVAKVRSAPQAELDKLQLALALVESATGNTSKSLQIAQTALKTTPQLKDTQTLRADLWGDKAISDVEKLFAQL